MRYDLLKGGVLHLMKTNKNLIIERWQDEAALQRFKLIAPLTNEDIDQARRVQLRKEIAVANELSYKTVKRYDDAYQRQGFEGLKPKNHRSAAFAASVASACSRYL